MLKATLFASVVASIAMGTNIAVNKDAVKVAPRDATIIVEVDRDNESLTEQGIVNTQRTVLNNIKRYVTSNVRQISSFSKTFNAFAITINSNDIELVKQVPGVKSVTLNELHWRTNYSEGEDGLLYKTGDSGEYGSSENISATTMNKPEDTNDGEGTLIAILDNEFYFRGKTKDSEGNPVDAWKHETYTELDSSVAVRFDGVKERATVQKTHAYAEVKSQKKTSAALGEEGSLYFNNKVPFYFDYGGEITKYSGEPVHDFDVHSTLSYHGSHVSSIAAGNADTYKGIAPKAQLVCMKVFTMYKASDLDKKLGLSSYSGAYDLPILEALEDCITLGVDGINMSLGSNLNDFDGNSGTMKVLTKLAESGILTSISAGNSGKSSFSTTGAYANWTKDMVETGILSGYANNASAMTIAAGQPTQLFYENGFKLNGNNIAYSDQIVNSDAWDTEWKKEYKTEDLFYDSGTGTYTKEVEWQYIPGFGTEADYVGLDVDGKIAVVNRGSTAFADKYRIAAGKGALGIVIINNDPTASDFNFRCSFGDGFKPTMPCCLVLYKDKPLFEAQQSGTITCIHKEVVNNPKSRTISSFSTDGATFDLDLKPEITAPGENIRGAVPPQKTEDKTEERKYKVYEYLSGTSMSAPNYAGAQSVVLSKEAAPIYQKETQTATDLSNLRKYRNTVNMRLMSTANPMVDYLENPETNEKTTTSPRMQGAGMVDLEGAYNTDVYLEGLDAQGKGTGKSKISLRNNADINKGDIKIKFNAYNESEEAVTYNVKLSVMRPAVAKTQGIVTKDYNDKGEVDKIENFPGHKYWVKQGIGENVKYVEKTSLGIANNKDVYKVSRAIEYYATEEDCKNDVKSTIDIGRYYNAGTATEPRWEDLPTEEYQSTQDVLIDEVTLSSVTVNPGKNTITLDSYSLSAQAKAKIAELYDYGCYIEGYVTLTCVDASQPDLSMPYMGFYSSLNEVGGDYSSCPVVEPFSFEKNSSTVYPSDLVNDIAKTLVGKDKHNMESMMVAGYLKPGESINTDAVLKNDDNFANLSGFSLLGINPTTGEYYEDAADNLYLGSENYSNTLIIQQFMLRSVADNYFTITNNETGEVAYRSVLADMLFGDSMGKYALYKSHVDENYLSAGYICHRAYAVVPMYNPDTGEAFASGDYTIQFNYLLSGTNTWVNKQYTLHIDSEAPEVKSITTEGDNVKINIKENNLINAVVGTTIAGFNQTDDGYVIEMSKDEIEASINENMNEYQGSGRLFVKLTDAANGQMGIVVRFSTDNDNNILWNNYVMVQHHSLTYANDFEDDGVNITVVKYDSYTEVETEVELDGFVLTSRGPVNYGGTVTTRGCSGNITTTSIILCVTSLIAITCLVISKKKKILGGKD